MNRYMIGRIAVRLVFVNGPDGQTRFLDKEIAAARAYVLDALLMLNRLARTNVPPVGIQFCVWSSVVPVSVQPAFNAIDLNHAASRGEIQEREKLWRDPALQQLVGDTGPIGIRKLRDATIGRADHAFSILWTKYECGVAAYTFVQGPHTVLCWPWLIDRRTPTSPGIVTAIAHEVGHIFGAPDEYAPCQLLSADGQGFGALRHPNLNCVDVNAQAEPCLMKMDPYQYCSHTRIHVGWADADKDGVLDVLQ